MSERLEFVKACLDRSEHIVRICDRFGISEKTGQKWLKRFKEGGLEALEDRSHAPLEHAGRITPEVAERIIALRLKYPLYGPAKLRDWLVLHESRAAGERWPAASSIGELLKRSNLIQRKRRQHLPIERAALDGRRTTALEANMVWTADFKGEFRLKHGVGAYCYPLTVLDLHTHYLLGCAALESVSIAGTKTIFVRLFKEYGLPQVLRTDNGIPFAQPNAIGRLGQLGFWWVRLGIRPEHISPGRPSENGAHERFHKTLKAGATHPSSRTLAAQQQRFDRFRSEYNNERPHSSLPGHIPPGVAYSSSPRQYPTKLPAVIYPDEAIVRLVNPGGAIKWRNQALFISSNLAGEYVGLTETGPDLISVCFGMLQLGMIDLQTNRFTPAVKWTA
jgi:transposase InsO family protein